MRKEVEEAYHKILDIITEKALRVEEVLLISELLKRQTLNYLSARLFRRMTEKKPRPIGK